MKMWIFALLSALALSALAVLLRLLQLETTGQLLWCLGIVAFIWCAVQISLLFRPLNREGRTIISDATGSTITRSKGRPRSFLERFFPGASLASGTYNKRNTRIWNGNEDLPNHQDD